MEITLSLLLWRIGGIVRNPWLPWGKWTAKARG
jgi:hypothetical protein